MREKVFLIDGFNSLSLFANIYFCVCPLLLHWKHTPKSRSAAHIPSLSPQHPEEEEAERIITTASAVQKNDRARRTHFHPKMVSIFSKQSNKICQVVCLFVHAITFTSHSQFEQENCFICHDDATSLSRFAFYNHKKKLTVSDLKNYSTKMSLVQNNFPLRRVWVETQAAGFRSSNYPLLVLRRREP